jgi:hypothetical protein
MSWGMSWYFIIYVLGYLWVWLSHHSCWILTYSNHVMSQCQVCYIPRSGQGQCLQFSPELKRRPMSHRTTGTDQSWGRCWPCFVGCAVIDTCSVAMPAGSQYSCAKKSGESTSRKTTTISEAGVSSYILTKKSGRK